DALRDITGTILFEFSIPRMGRRIDAVVLTGPIVFVLEFKVGASSFERAAIDQVWDYALDLKNFHEASEAVAILPILIATEALTSHVPGLNADPDGVFHPLRVGSSGLREVIEKCVCDVSGVDVNALEWSRGRYRPTPTIIDAARALYAQHSVEAI